jgi:hypothetical protein
MPDTSKGTAPLEPDPIEQILIPIQLILGDWGLPDGARIILFWLWRLAGYRPSRIVTNKHELAAHARRDVRTVEGNLKRLKKAGKIEYEWDKERGAIEVYVFHPAPGKQEGRPDPQKRLPLVPTGDEGPVPATSPPSDAPTTSVQSPCKPCADLTQNVPTQNAQPMAPQGNRNSGLERSAQNVPSLNETKEGICATSKPQRTVRFNDNANEGPNRGREPDSGAFHVAGAMVEALEAATAGFEAGAHPTAQKERLRARILSAAGVQDADWWVAGQGADLVVSYRYPIEKMEALLREVERGHQLPSKDRHHIYNPGGCLQSKLAKIAQQYGMKWGKSRESN